MRGSIPDGSTGAEEDNGIVAAMEQNQEFNIFSPLCFQEFGPAHPDPGPETESGMG
jgi:hypothetical protein